MRRFIDLYSYARLIRCVADEFSNEPDWMSKLREKLYCKMNRLENNVGWIKVVIVFYVDEVENDFKVLIRKLKNNFPIV